MCVMDSPALWTQRSVCTVKFVKSLAIRNRFGVDFNLLLHRILLPCPWYIFARNVISSSVGGSDYQFSIRVKHIVRLRHCR